MFGQAKKKTYIRCIDEMFYYKSSLFRIFLYKHAILNPDRKLQRSL